MHRFCRYCGKELTIDNSATPKRYDAEFCNDDCRTNYHNQRRSIDRHSEAIQRNVNKLAETVNHSSSSVASLALQALQKHSVTFSAEQQKALDKIQEQVAAVGKQIAFSAEQQKALDKIQEQVAAVDKQVALSASAGLLKTLEQVAGPAKQAFLSAEQQKALDKIQEQAAGPAKQIAKLQGVAMLTNLTQKPLRASQERIIAALTDALNASQQRIIAALTDALNASQQRTIAALTDALRDINDSAD